MYITWKGFGLAVPPIAIATVGAAIVASNRLASSGIMTPIWSQRVAWSASTLVGAGLIWALAMHMAGKPRKRTNPKTGKEFLGRDHAYAGYFCFLPTRFWAVVLLALGVTMVVAPKIFD